VLSAMCICICLIVFVYVWKNVILRSTQIPRFISLKQKSEKSHTTTTTNTQFRNRPPTIKYSSHTENTTREVGKPGLYARNKDWLKHFFKLILTTGIRLYNKNKVDCNTKYTTQPMISAQCSECHREEIHQSASKQRE